MEKLLPTQYRIEFYEESFSNDPTFSVESSSPPVVFSVGDYVDQRAWGMETNADMTDRIFKVKAVNHLVWQIEKSHIGHSLSVCVVPVPRGEAFA